jgi:hypothetical protein
VLRRDPREIACRTHIHVKSDLQPLLLAEFTPLRGKDFVPSGARAGTAQHTSHHPRSCDDLHVAITRNSLKVFKQALEFNQRTITVNARLNVRESWSVANDHRQIAAHAMSNLHAFERCWRAVTGTEH